MYMICVTINTFEFEFEFEFEEEYQLIRLVNETTMTKYKERILDTDWSVLDVNDTCMWVIFFVFHEHFQIHL